MTNHSNFKLGVLNMTISFDPPHTTRQHHRYSDTPINKMHPIPSFIPKNNRGYPQRSIIHSERKEGSMNPYQSYRSSQRASIRYYRDQHEQSRRRSALSAGVSFRQSKTLDIEFNSRFDNQQNQQESKAFTKPLKGTGLKFTINKKHLKHFPHQNNQNLLQDNFIFKLDENPEESLRHVFTVRPVKTSFRARRDSKDKNGKISVKYPVSKQQFRQKKNKVSELLQKTIRPWSPNRGGFNKELLQSEMMLSGYPHQQQ